MSVSPPRVYRAITEAYLKYYDTAFRLRDEGLREERRELLQADGVVFTDPLIEPVLPYQATDPINDVCEEIGVGGEIGAHLADMLFDAGPDFRLRAHQAE